MTEQTQSEVLILGGGLAGAMAALRLSAAGRTTVLIEKEREAHHKVCGEFLSPEAVYYLRNAGIDTEELGAVPIQDLCLSTGSRSVETRLPFVAHSLSRHILDEALLARAAETGARILRGVPVQNLELGANTWTAQLADQTNLRSQAVFLATGKHDLRGWPRPQGVQSDLVGFKLHYQLSPEQTRRLHNRMELFLFRGGYGGLALVEHGVANLCLVVRKRTLRKHGAWPALFASLIAENRRLREFLASADPLWSRPLAISSIPYGHLGSPYLSGLRSATPDFAPTDLLDSTNCHPEGRAQRGVEGPAVAFGDASLSTSPSPSHKSVILSDDPERSRRGGVEGPAAAFGDPSSNTDPGAWDLSPLVPRPSPLQAPGAPGLPTLETWDGRPPTLWPIGDQIACIPSFTGDGMSIALHSAASAAQAYLVGTTPSAYQTELVAELKRGMQLATALSRACVTPAARTLAPAALALLPQTLAWIASATRIPAHALRIQPQPR